MSRIYKLGKRATERGSYTVSFTIKDYMGFLVNTGNINSLYWWLTNNVGDVINGRSRVSAYSSLTNPVLITLSDEDLQITDKDRGENTRILTIRGDYNSTLGLGLPFTYSVSFDIDNAVVVDIDLNISVIDPIYVRESVDVQS